MIYPTNTTIPTFTTYTTGSTGKIFAASLREAYNNLAYLSDSAVFLLVGALTFW